MTSSHTTSISSPSHAPPHHPSDFPCIYVRQSGKQSLKTTKAFFKVFFSPFFPGCQMHFRLTVGLFDEGRPRARAESRELDCFLQRSLSQSKIFLEGNSRRRSGGEEGTSRRFVTSKYQTNRYVFAFRDGSAKTPGVPIQRPGGKHIFRH